MGTSSVTGGQTIIFADNVSFDGTPRGGAVTSDGQLLIGSSVAPYIRPATLTQGSNITITNGHGTITLDVPAGGGLSLGAFGSSPNANGLSLATGVLNMQPADGSFPGGVSTTTQTFAGYKTFSNPASSPNFVSGTTSTVSAAGITLMNIASTRIQVLTGSTTQTYQLPNATTLTAGWAYEFNNNSTGLLTIINFSSGLVGTVPSGGYARVSVSDVSTSAGVWELHYLMPSNANYGTSGMTVTGTISATSTISSGVAGSSIGGYNLSGNTSGTISVLPQAAAGTYNFNLPTTAGTSGYFLTSGGGGSSPMTWTAPGGGGITTINGDSGSVTGSTITITTGQSSNNSGSSISFSGSGTTLTLNLSDSNTNTTLGYFSGYISGMGGSSNTAVGGFSLQSLSGGSNNTGIGYQALQQLDGVNNNTAVGYRCLPSGTTGEGNTALGINIGTSLGSGGGFPSWNTFIGYESGSNYAAGESSNILINSDGVSGDNNVLRIGKATGADPRELTAAYISGINGNTVSNTQIVSIDSSTDQLGTLDYQEGTWTPTVDGATPGTTTYSVQEGYYTKIGNMVWVSGLIIISAATGTGNAIFGGLPFTVKNQTNYAPRGSANVNSTSWAWPASTTALFWQLTANSTDTLISAQGSTTGSSVLQMTNGSCTFTLNGFYQV